MPELDREKGIGDVLDHLALTFHRQALVEDALFEWIVVGVGEDIGEDGQPEVGGEGRHFTDRIGERDIILVLFLTVRGVGAVEGLFLLFDGNLRLLDRFLRLDLAQIFFIQETELLVDLHLAVEVKSGVGRMIILLVVGNEILIGELDDVVGMTAGDGGVLARLIALAEYCLIQRFFGITQSALHLIVDDALIVGLAVFIALDMPALLTEGVLVIIDQRTEHRVGVDRHQVHQILVVHARHGIHRLVGEGHRVEKGVQRAFHQLDKGIVNGILL